MGKSVSSDKILSPEDRIKFGKAIEEMQRRSIPENVIKETIQKKIKEKGYAPVSWESLTPKAVASSKDTMPKGEVIESSDLTLKANKQGYGTIALSENEIFPLFDKHKETLRQSFAEPYRASMDIPKTDMPAARAMIDIENRYLTPEERDPAKQIISDKTLDAIIESGKKDQESGRVLIDKIVTAIPTSKDAVDLQKFMYTKDYLNNPEIKDKDRVVENLKGISEGKYTYDTRSGSIYEPVGFLESITESYKDTRENIDLANVAGDLSDEELISLLDKERTSKDPLSPIKVPGMLGGVIGGTPIRAWVGSAIASAAPATGPFAPAVYGLGGGLAGSGMKDLAYGRDLRQVYNEQISAGKDPKEALRIAKEAAEKTSLAEGVVGGASAIVGARLGVRRAPISFKEKSALSAVKELLTGNNIKLDIIEGAGIGIAAGFSRGYQNQILSESGVNVNPDEGVMDEVLANFLFTVGAGGIGGIVGRVTPAIKGKLKSWMATIDPETIDFKLNEMVSNKTLDEWTAEAVKNEINAYKTVSEQLPHGVDPDKVPVIVDKMTARVEIEQGLENMKEPFLSKAKEEIKKLDKEILELSKPTENYNIVVKNVEEGNIPPMYAQTALADPESFYLSVYQQAEGLNADGTKSPYGGTEAMMRQTFGDEIVDRAYSLHQPKVSEEILIGDLVNQRVNYNNKEGDLYIDENKVIFSPKDKSPEVIIGDVRSLSDSSAESLGVTPAEKIVTLNEDNTFDIRGRKYDASEENVRMNYDDEGNLKSVTLLDEKGKPKTFRGQVGEDIAYEMNLREIDKNNVLKEEFEEFLNTDTDAKSIIEKDNIPEVQKVEQSGSAENINEVQQTSPAKVKGDDGSDVLTTKNKKDAVQKQKPNEVDVRQQAGDGEKVGKGDAESDVATTKSKKEKSKVEEPELTEKTIKNKKSETSEEANRFHFKHSAMDERAAAMGWGERTKTKTTLKSIDEEAVELAKDQKYVDKLISHVKKNGNLSAVETATIARYFEDLETALSKDPSNNAVFNKMEEVRNILDVSGSNWGVTGVLRKRGLINRDSLFEFQQDEVRFTSTKGLDAKQADEKIKAARERATKEYKEQQKLTDDLEVAMGKDIDDYIDKKIKEILSEKKTEGKGVPKETKKDIIDSIRQKLKESRGEAKSSFVGLAEDLLKIAPDVARLVRLMVNEGLSNLDDILKQLRKDLPDDLVASDYELRALIAGAFTSSQQTRSARVKALRDLKTEASLVNKLEDLEKGIVSKRGKKKEEMNERIAELRKQINEHDLTRLDKLKESLKKKIQDIEKELEQERILQKEARKELIESAETRELRTKLNKLKEDRLVRLAKQEYAARTKGEKVWDALMIPANEFKTFRSSWDLSGLLRQGVIPALGELVTDPKEFAAKTKRMTQAFGSEEAFRKRMDFIQNDPDYWIMQRSGLAIADPTKLSTREEVFQGRYLQKIPILGKGFKGSERSYSLILNEYRYQMFKTGMAKLEKAGILFEENPEAYRQLAKVVNILTGRGDIPKFLKPYAPALNFLFFSPRFIMSRLQLVTMWHKLPKPIRNMAIKDLALYLGTGSLILGSAALAINSAGGDAEVELDPRSTDFAQLKAGDVRYDIFGGMTQYIRAAAQLITGTRKDTRTGMIRDLSRYDKISKEEKGGRLENVGRFFWYKANPLLTALYELYSGKDFIGQPQTPEEWAISHLTPMSAGGYIEVAENRDFQSLVNLIAEAFGISVKDYNK